MLDKAEEDLVVQITKTNCYYKLIGQARQSLNLFQFFDDIEKMKVEMEIEVRRRGSIQTYLQENSRLMDPLQEF